MENSILVEVSKEKRIYKAIVAFAVTIGITSCGVFLPDKINLDTLWIMPFFFTGLYATYKFYHTTQIKQLTVEAQQAEKEQRIKDRSEAEEFDNRWYIRYPFALSMLWAAGYIMDKNPLKWWLAGILALTAAYHAREVSAILIVLGLIYFLVKGVASLPTGLAIIVGVIIVIVITKE